MNQLAHTFQSYPLGASFEDAQVTAFFGQRGSDVASLENAFPDYRFVSLKQTHSDIVILSPSKDEMPEGDAQMTNQRRVALCIRTADCIPVLIHDRENGLIAAIHAGWRGIENEIIRRTGEKLIGAGAQLKNARAWIGPHIGVQSFEVGLDVAARLEATFESVRSYSDVTTTLVQHKDEAKNYVDLISIARAQLASIGIERDRTQEIGIDTFQSPIHDSFRRDREGGRRQNSFIAIK